MNATSDERAIIIIINNCKMCRLANSNDVQPLLRLYSQNIQITSSECVYSLLFNLAGSNKENVYEKLIINHQHDSLSAIIDLILRANPLCLNLSLVCSAPRGEGGLNQVLMSMLNAEVPGVALLFIPSSLVPYIFVTLYPLSLVAQARDLQGVHDFFVVNFWKNIVGDLYM